MNQQISVYGELLTASEDSRTLSYKLLPFEETGRTNLGKVRVSKDAVKIPRDISHLVLNTEHAQDSPVGRFVSVTPQDDALYATVHLSDFERGNEALQAALSGEMKGISVEIRNPIIKAGRLIDGELTGAALCKTPAFSSAMLTASDMGDVTALLEQIQGLLSVINGDAEEEAEEETEDPAEEAEETPAEETAEETQELPDEAPEEEKETFMSATNAAPAAEMLSAVAMGADKPKNKNALRELGDLLTAAASRGASPALHAAVTQITEANSYDVTAVPDYVGELFNLQKGWRTRYQNLITGRTLTSKQVIGWKWNTTPIGAADYAGFPAQIGTNTPTVQQVTTTASELAAGHELDRLTLTLNDGGYVASYLEMCMTDWNRQMDIKTLDFLSTNSTAVTGGGSGPYDKLITGAQKIADYGIPTFAVLGSAAWATMMKTQSVNVLELLSTSLGLTDGEFEGFKIIPAPTFYDTTKLGANDVIVGTGEAASLYTLPGGPVRLELADFQANGVLKGLWGAYAFLLHDARALLKVSA